MEEKELNEAIEKIRDEGFIVIPIEKGEELLVQARKSKEEFEELARLSKAYINNTEKYIKKLEAEKHE